MKHTTRITTLFTALLAVAVLAGCGTTAINQQAMQAHSEALESQRLAIDQHNNACATTAAACAEDMCRVATMLACALGQPDQRIEQPRLRSPGDEFARGFSPISNTITGLGNVWGGIGIAREVRRGNVGSVQAAGNLAIGLAENIQGPVDNSTNVRGNLGDTRGDEVGGNIGDTNHGRIGSDGDDVGGDQRIGPDVRDSCVGEACRNHSPGPIDNSDNSDHSTGPPTDDPDGGG